MKYKITVSNRQMFMDIPLPEDTCCIKAGTEFCCDVHFRKDLFCSPVILKLEKTHEKWQLTVSDGLYLDADDVSRLLSVFLNEDQRLGLYQDGSENRLLDIEFSPYYEETAVYDRCIDISGRDTVSIGSSGKCSIYLPDADIPDIRVILKRWKDSFAVVVSGSGRSVYRNGEKLKEGDRILCGDFFTVGSFHFYLEDDRIWTCTEEKLIITGFGYADLPDRNTYPLFNRKTRIKTVPDEKEIEILDPPSLPSEPEDNILFRILPALGMLTAAGVMAARGSAVMLVFSGISAGTAILTAISGLIRGKKKYRDELEKRKAAYEHYISDKKKEISVCRQKEKEIRRCLYKPVSMLLSMLDTFSPELFDRNINDEDFLCVRLGQGTVPAGKRINCQQQERIEPEDELQRIPQLLAEEYKYLRDCPVVCDLKKTGALGIAGCEEERYFLLKRMVIDLAARHWPDDVKMVFAALPENADKINLFRLLPNVLLDETGIRGIAADKDSRDHVFDYLCRQFLVREESGKKYPGIVVFVYDDFGFRTHPLSLFVDKAASFGITFVFFRARKEQIINGCDYIIEIVKPGRAVMIRTQDGSEKIDFEYERICDDALENAVQILAPVDTGHIAPGSTLAPGVSLFSLLGAFTAEDIDLGDRWKNSGIRGSLAAPLGISGQGVFYLDIHDQAMGPHGLIAGTTGSGKSELLQSYILSMAATYHPGDVRFLIIDFKGGGMAASLRELPHMAGVITNIDSREIRRSLKAIRAELIKRQKLFDEAGVNHIDRYIEKYKKTEMIAPLSHLIIIADEFAELKAQYPEFMKELISAARIGRSLGVHLILATQKPSGQVDDQIWSNSRFRICLKVRTASDSNEVIRSALASQIKEPGRAYLQVGNDEIFELIQAAYSSGPAFEGEGCIKDFEIYSISASGKKERVFRSDKTQPDRTAAADETPDQGLTQAQALVKHIKEYCEQEHIVKLPDIIQPPLEGLIDYPEIRDRITGSAIRAGIGIYDDPDRQYQGEYRINLSEQNLIITGSARSGKTNILKNIIRGAAQACSSEELNIYIIDYASAELKVFESLNHVGGVVCAGEEEKTKQLFRFLNEQKKKRKDTAHILLIIDNLPALRELYLQEDDELPGLLREGISCGISLAVTSPRISGTAGRYLADFSCRLALNCNDAGEYSYLFGRCRQTLPEICGRCLIEINREQYECQAYKAFKGFSREAENAEILSFIRRMNERNPNKVKPIPVIPEILTGKEMSEHCGYLIRKRFEVAAGLDYADIKPFIMDLSETGVIPVLGRKGSGRHNWVRYLISCLSEQRRDNILVFAADGIGRRFSWLKDRTFTAEYGIRPDQGIRCVMKIRQILKNRYSDISAGRSDLLDKEPLILLLLDSTDALNEICADPEALKAYREITGKYRGMNVCILIMCMENVGISYHSPEILKNIRDERHCICFDDIRDLKLFDLPVSVIRNAGNRFSAGEAYYIRNNHVRRLKTPLLQADGISHSGR